jgi:hypothetical protein
MRTLSAAEQAYLVAEMRGAEINFHDQYLTAPTSATSEI